MPLRDVIGRVQSQGTFLKRTFHYFGHVVCFDKVDACTQFQIQPAAESPAQDDVAEGLCLVG